MFSGSASATMEYGGGVPHWGSRLSAKGTRPSYQIFFGERRFSGVDVCGPAQVPLRHPDESSEEEPAGDALDQRNAKIPP